MHLTPLINIRPENPGDYPAIAEINARAFGRAGEGAIVALSRQRVDFDPELSLVAEIDGKAVGHALFSPQTIRLMDLDVGAVLLGPIAVVPEHQGQRIGAALITEGHRIATSKNYSVSFLVGHDTYYPRLGYRTGAYGNSVTEVSTAGWSEVELAAGEVRREDLPELRELWQRDEAGVDFAIDPGGSITDWISPNPTVRSIVFRDADGVVGYARGRSDRPNAPACFLAREPENARAIASWLAREAQSDVLELPIHPRSRSAAAFPPATVKPFSAAMAIELSASPLGAYFRVAESGRRPAGRVIWPVAFDL